MPPFSLSIVIRIYFRTKTKELQQELSESNSNAELLKSDLESQKSEFDEKLENLTSTNSDLQDKIEKADSDITNLNSSVQVLSLSFDF